MGTEVVNPLTFHRWDDLLRDCPNGSFFHTSYWARVLADSYGYVPRYFSVVDGSALRALIPVMEIDSILTGRRGVSLPFSDYCEPFAADNDQYRCLVESILRHGMEAKWRTFEIRGGDCPGRETKASSEFHGHRLDLGPTEDELFSRLRTNMQRNVKKAAKSEVKVVFLNSIDALEVFYRLNCITRKEHGIPPQPMVFFRKIHEHVFSRNLGSVALASHQDRFVAGAVFFHFGRKAIYKYGASDEEGKTCRANNLLMWEAIKRYRQAGCAEFCFGRTEQENPGLREYKLGYGTEEYLLRYYKFEIGRQCVTNDSGRRMKFVNRAFRRLPIPVSRGIGSLLYRHIG